MRGISPFELPGSVSGLFVFLMRWGGLDGLVRALAPFISLLDLARPLRMGLGLGLRVGARTGLGVELRKILLLLAPLVGVLCTSLVRESMNSALTPAL